ncbi:branched-chain amino acid aminotransferase [Micromonospora matsumotoense]|uniref:Branched-chain amino acid aminotransferase n=1 Tax=Micromonospora matsumotoense TaxID=121616 RepID=A0A1C4Z6E8_9ACTN|nr:aminotransferase class IV [Micromonospora matsumotoense]SCF28513.1 branched-chain amino acid aminotransferase [Micromonospora matsumotoense]
MSGASADGRTGAVWPLAHHRGALVPKEAATLPMGSLALRYGISVFEGVRLYHQDAGGVVPWLLDPHLDRLRNSCRIMGLDESCCASVPAIIDELVAAQGIDADGYVRIAVSAANVGGIDEAAESALTVTVAPAGRKRWLAHGEGIRLAVSSWQRPSDAVFPSTAKNISAYAGPRLALAEARQAGFDSCVLRTAEGLISEAPTATVVLVEDGRVVTPRLDDHVLPGVTRSWVLATARALGHDAIEDAVTEDRLRAADEVVLCGTGLEFGPVRTVADRALPGWPVCPVTTELVDAYFDQARGRTAPTRLDWALIARGAR